MISHRQEYPLRTTVCPLLADQRQALSARFCLVEVRNHARRAYRSTSSRGLISATMFRGPVRLKPPASRTYVTPWNGWLCQMCMVIDRPRPRSTRSAGAGEEVSPFSVSVSAPRCCGFVTSRSQLRFVAVVVENDSLSFFSRQLQTGVLQLLEPFLLVLGLKKKAPKRMVLKIDRRRVVLLSFFSPGTACNLSWRHSPSHAKPCWLVAAIHPESTTNWPERKRLSMHRRSPATNKVVEILILGTYLLLERSFDYLRASPSNSRDTPLWSYDFVFSKSPQKMKKITSSSKQETENKKINEPSWSPFDCVTSRVTQQHNRRYFQLDLTMSCRESMLQLQLQFPASRGTVTCFCSCHMQSWTWRQNQSARNLNHFCRAPFRISGHIRWPITPLFFGIFLSFFHSMLNFHYFTSMHGKNLKVLCFKTAIWRTLIARLWCHHLQGHDVIT